MLILLDFCDIGVENLLSHEGNFSLVINSLSHEFHIVILKPVFLVLS